MTRSLNSVLHFGKYRGLSVGAIAKFDPLYLDWALSNIDGFALDKDAKAVVYPAIKKERQFSMNQQEAWCWGFGLDAKRARDKHRSRQTEIEFEERRKAGHVVDDSEPYEIKWLLPTNPTHSPTVSEEK